VAWDVAVCAALVISQYTVANLKKLECIYLLIVSNDCSFMHICTAVLLHRCNITRTCLRMDWIL